MKTRQQIATAIADKAYTILKDHFNGLKPMVMVPCFIHNQIREIAAKALSGPDKWKKIADSKVRNIWVCPNKKCDRSVVSPDWYAGNGTPMCECDEDMEYSHTEIKIPDSKE